MGKIKKIYYNGDNNLNNIDIRHDIPYPPKINPPLQ